MIHPNDMGEAFGDDCDDPYANETYGYLAEWDGGWLIRPTRSEAREATLALGIPEAEFHVVPNHPDFA